MRWKDIPSGALQVAEKLVAEGGRGFNPCKKVANERGLQPWSFFIRRYPK
jgi:hypothetical protein